MAITNKTEATTGPNGIINAVPTNGAGNIQATNFHSYFADLLDWLFPGASTNKGAVLTASETDYSLAWEVLIPVATVIMRSYDFDNPITAPDGWLFCNGSEVDIATYPDLYNVIGNYYAGNNTPTIGKFYLPEIGKQSDGVLYVKSTGADTDPGFIMGSGTSQSAEIAFLIKY